MFEFQKGKKGKFFEDVRIAKCWIDLVKTKVLPRIPS